MDLSIEWTCRRMDFPDDGGVPVERKAIEIDGTIRVDGAPAGVTDGFYLLDEEPWSMEAFEFLWDEEQWTCEIFEELIEPETRRFRQPLPRLLDSATGILYLRLIALSPEFRGRGLGRELLKEWIGKWCDRQVGAVVIDARPLQRRPEGFEDYDEEVRDLPWDRPEEDGERLARYLRGWGFHRMTGTRFMVASPKWLGLPGATHPVEVEWPEDDFEEDSEFGEDESKFDPGDDSGDDVDYPF